MKYLNKSFSLAMPGNKGNWPFKEERTSVQSEAPHGTMTLFGFPVRLDPAIPPGEIHFCPTTAAQLEQAGRVASVERRGD